MVYAKKSLGQHFLKNEGILNKIAEAGDIHADDLILEIGPGTGALTRYLLALAGKVIAVEKDHELFLQLQEQFKKEIKEKKLELIEDDILTWMPEQVRHDTKKKFKIIANIPYNITGAIFKKFLSADFQPSEMIVLIQEEVADRIVARDGKESILSLSVKAYGIPKKLFKVAPGSFSPPPAVNSAVLKISNISKNNFGNIKDKNSKKLEDRFFELVKAGFAHKRKKLGSNLKNVFLSPPNLGGVPSPRGEGVLLKELKDARAEDLSLDDWLALAKI